MGDLMIRNAQQYLDDSRVELALAQKHFVDLDTFATLIKFGVEEGVNKLFDPKYDREKVRAELKQRLEWDYYLMIEELMGLYCAYDLRRRSSSPI